MGSCPSARQIRLSGSASRERRAASILHGLELERSGLRCRAPWPCPAFARDPAGRAGSLSTSPLCPVPGQEAGSARARCRCLTLPHRFWCFGFAVLPRETHTQRTCVCLWPKKSKIKSCLKLILLKLGLSRKHWLLIIIPFLNGSFGGNQGFVPFPSQRYPRVHGPRGAAEGDSVRQQCGLVLAGLHALQAAERVSEAACPLCFFFFSLGLVIVCPLTY